MLEHSETEQAVQLPWNVQSDAISSGLEAWVRDYIASENEEVMRPRFQAICPFAGAALRSGLIKVAVFPEIDGTDGERIESLTRDSLYQFPDAWAAGWALVVDTDSRLS